MQCMAMSDWPWVKPMVNPKIAAVRSAQTHAMATYAAEVSIYITHRSPSKTMPATHRQSSPGRQSRQASKDDPGRVIR